MEIDNANCKVKVSECTDVESLTIDRPIKIDREITDLQNLVVELHRLFSYDHVNIHDVQKLMAGYKSDPKDWRKFAKFDRFRYTRNLVDAGNGLFNIMILCWGAGHASAIHDHADSHCFMKILSGNLEEVRYDWPEKVEPEVRKALKNNSKPVRRCCSESEDFDNNCTNGGCQNRMNGGSQNGGSDDGEDGNCENGGLANEMVEIGRTRLELNDVCYINDALGLHRMENPSHVDSAISLHLYCPPFDTCRVFDARTGKPTNVNVTFTSVYGKKVNRVMQANNVADSQQ